MTTRGTERRREIGKIRFMREATYGAAQRAGSGPRLVAKSCNTCGCGLQQPECFSKSIRNADGLQGMCKGCNARWQRDNGEARRDTWTRYRRATYLEEKYGITIEEYWQLYAAQNERCALCGLHGDDAGQHTVQQLPLHVDHDHETGAVRGLLCRCCNMGLGSFKDNVATMQKAIAYVRRPSPPAHMGLPGEGCVFCGVKLTNRTRGRRCLPSSNVDSQLTVDA